jgi:hypothetical protein
VGRVTDIHGILHEPVAGDDGGKGDSTILLYSIVRQGGSELIIYVVCKRG